MYKIKPTTQEKRGNEISMCKVWWKKIGTMRINCKKVQD